MNDRKDFQMGMVIVDRPNRGKADITVEITLPVMVTRAERERLVLHVTEAVGDAVPMERARVRVNVYAPRMKRR